jgi:hypothetical protein
MAVAMAGIVHAQPQIGPPGGGGGGGGQPAPSSTGIINGTTADLTASAMQEAGFTDVRVVESNGVKHVVGKAGETPVVALHMYCKEGTCLAISYMVFFGEQTSIGWDYVNAWNSRNTFARLSRNSKNNLVFDYDVLLIGGVTAQYIKTAGMIYAQRLKELFQFKPGGGSN